MKKRKKGFYNYLKDQIGKYPQEEFESIKYLPDFYSLLDKVLEDVDDREDKSLIVCALAYLISPNDIVPEDIYGLSGWIDDLYLCSWVLLKLKDKNGIGSLNPYWDLDKDLNQALEDAYKESLKVIDEYSMEEDIFKYIGLED